MEKIVKLNHYDVSEVIDTFEIERVTKCDILTNWLNASGALTASEVDFLERIRLRLLRDWNSWNEEEIKMNFLKKYIQK